MAEPLARAVGLNSGGYSRECQRSGQGDEANFLGACSGDTKGLVWGDEVSLCFVCSGSAKGLFRGDESNLWGARS